MKTECIYYPLQTKFVLKYVGIFFIYIEYSHLNRYKMRRNVRPKMCRKNKDICFSEYVY